MASCQGVSTNAQRLIPSICILVLVFSASTYCAAGFIQNGARFPQGLVVGSDAECDNSSEGRLRYFDGRLQVCHENGTWASTTGDRMSLEQVEQLLLDILELLERRENITELLERVLEQQQSYTTPQGQVNSLYCLGHGEYTTGMNSFNEAYCECYRDNERGHYEGAQCGFCIAGWTRDQFGDCVVDIEDPTLVLFGEKEEFVFVGEPWVEPGFESLDNHDGDIASRVVITGTVNTSVIDTYPLVYTIEDEAGHVVTDSRVVHVVDHTLLRSAPATRVFLEGISSNTDACSNSQCTTRELYYYKHQNSSQLRVLWSDNYRCRTTSAVSHNSVGCRWEIKINGSSCDSPAPMYQDLHTHGTVGNIGETNTYVNFHWGFTFMAYCNSYGGGIPLVGGETYHLTIHEIGSSFERHGEPYLGWPGNVDDGNTFLIEATEVLDEGHVSIAFPPRQNTQIAYNAAVGTEFTARRFTFNQPSSGTALRFNLYDSWRCRAGHSSHTYTACGLEFKIDGESCVTPGPMIWDSYHSPYTNIHHGNMLTLYCSETSSGPIAAGEHTFGVFTRQVLTYQMGNPYLGWNLLQSVYEVVPVPSSLEYTIFPALREDDTVDGVVPSTRFQFNKREYGSEVKITWSDNFRCRSQSSASATCKHRILIDGMRCAEPGPLQVDQYGTGPSAGFNNHFTTTVVGWCRKLENGMRITPGSHWITIEESFIKGHTHGEPFIGWRETRGAMTVEEVAHFRYDSVSDILPPDVLIHGNSEHFVFLGEPYVEPGFEAWDDRDQNITDRVVVSGAAAIDENVLGTYFVNYSVSDNAGFSTVVTRTVHVVQNTIYRTAPPSMKFLLPVESNLDECTNAICPTRTTSYYKHQDDSKLRLVWSDNYRCRQTDGNSVGCRWEWKINGESCSEPGPMIQDLHTHGTDGHISSTSVALNFHYGFTYVGYCSKVGQGYPLVSGQNYTLELYEVGSSFSRHGAPALGWPAHRQASSVHMVEVSEVLEDADTTLHFPSRTNQEVTYANVGAELTSRQTTFYQPETGGMMRFSLFDNWRCRGGASGHTSVACGIEFVIDDEPCVSPGPMEFAVYASPYINMHHGTQLIYICNETTSGPISEGYHTLKLMSMQVLSYQAGNIYTGWNQIGASYEISPVRDEVQYGALGLQRNDGTKNDIAPSTKFTFTKKEYGSDLRITWNDNFRCSTTSSAYATCRWDILIDGQQCAEPGKLSHVVYNVGSSNGFNQHFTTTIAGWCYRLENGLKVAPGEHTIEILETHVSTYTHGSPYLGWQLNPGYMEVEEVAQFKYDSFEDILPPDLVLKGEPEEYIFIGETFEDPGYIAFDDRDQNITDSVVVSGLDAITSGAPESFVITYNVSDSAGLTTIVTRTVHVIHEDILRSTPPERFFVSGTSGNYDQCDNAQCTSRQFHYTKHQTKSKIRLSWGDNIRCKQTSTSSAGCRWEWLINGTSCFSPNRLFIDLHSHGSNGHISSTAVAINHHWGTTFTGYCDSYNGGMPLVAGETYHFTLHEVGSSFSRHGDPILGWPANQNVASTFYMDVREVLDEDFMTINYPPLSNNARSSSEGAGKDFPNREMTFTQPETGGMLRFNLMDNWRCRTSTTTAAVACGLEFFIDGESCAFPAPMIWDYYHNPMTNVHFPNTMLYFCNATTSGALAAGTHTLTVKTRQVGTRVMGDAYIGWNQQPAVYEIVPVRDMTQYKALGSKRGEGAENAILPNTFLDFNKATYGSDVRINWHDNFRCRSTTSNAYATCSYHILIDGQECIEPGPIRHDIYVHASSTLSNNHFTTTISGWCSRLEDGFRIRPGAHTVQVKESSIGTYTHGDAYLGWDFTYGAMEVEELQLQQYEVDEEEPTIELAGSEIIVLSVGDTYEEPGWEAWDNVDGDITLSGVHVDGTVNTAVADTYTLTYTATDSSGLQSAVQRNVLVQ